MKTWSRAETKINDGCAAAVAATTEIIQESDDEATRAAGVRIITMTLSSS